jgi:hypothetical protein
MTKSPLQRTWTLGILLMILTVLPALASGRVYEVTITNLTKGQILSPPIVYSHEWGFRLFTVGQPALPELAGVAEDADSEPLLALLTAEPRVHGVGIADGVVMPGQSATVRIETHGNARIISTLGMLVTTNDAFFAARRGAPPRRASLYAEAWDAGSEANTQDCAHIPGPPCGNGGVRVEEGAEGYIYTHAGIQDRGSLTAEDHDWNNPVARVEIRRVDR